MAWPAVVFIKYMELVTISYQVHPVYILAHQGVRVQYTTYVVQWSLSKEVIILCLWLVFGVEFIRKKLY